jgi:hypothetical protein
LARENGYVIVEATALLTAAIRKVNLAPGSSRLDLGRHLLKNSYKKNVILGFRVRISEAEYPDQNPWKPFSERIEEAMSETDTELVLTPDRAEIMDAVFFRVTILAIGVVNNLENAPARTPMLSSSNTGKEVTLPSCF